MVLGSCIQGTGTNSPRGVGRQVIDTRGGGGDGNGDGNDDSSGHSGAHRRWASAPTCWRIGDAVMFYEADFEVLTISKSSLALLRESQRRIRLVGQAWRASSMS